MMIVNGFKTASKKREETTAEIKIKKKISHPGMVAVDEELRLGPGGSGSHAGRRERIQHRFVASSAAATVVHFVAAAGLGEHADALGRGRAFVEHRVASGVRSTCGHLSEQNIQTCRR